MSATCTAQIIVGSFTTGWGSPGLGIGPDRVMYLVEGSRAAWVLEKVEHHSDSDDVWTPRTWVASDPERILVDGLVMVAALYERNPRVVQLIEGLGPKRAKELLDSDYASLGEIEEESLAEIEAASCEAVRAKLVITAMRGSSLYGQLALLDRCSMDAEVCTVSWCRQMDDEGKTQVAGELPPDDPENHRFTAIRLL